MLQNSKSRFSAPRTVENRFSQIPTMVSEISKKITDFRQRFRKLVDNAEVFFDEYQDQYRSLAVLKRKIDTFQEQLDRIDAYRKEKGKYPSIKGQPSTQRYIARLVAQQTKLEDEHRDLEKTVNTARNERYEALDHLTDEILDLLHGHQIFGQFLGTIALSTPSPEDKVRHIRNEKYKPIYIAALTIALFEEVRFKHTFAYSLLNDELKTLFPTADKFSLMANKNDASNTVNLARQPMASDTKLAYRESILKPLAKAALLQSIGLHSPEAQQVLGRDRYRRLNNSERASLLSIIDKKTMDYIKLGVGIPSVRFDSREEKAAFIANEQKQLTFMIDILSGLKKTGHELGDLIRIPMTYASFLLSTKKDFDYREIYRAYDIIEESMQRKANHPTHVSCFLKMVGRFPLGSGIYFIQEESGEIERAIVSSLYPFNVEEPICKQITRRQIQFLSQSEVVVSKKSNLFYAQSREKSHYEPEFLTARYHGDFTWNAADLWESQISSLAFWKKDGVRKTNGRYNPDSY